MHWDPIFSGVRGNVSSVKGWRDLPTGKWVTTTVRHDVLGNVLEVDDPEGNTTTVDYVDNFINSSTPELPSNKKTYAFVTSGSNELTHSVSTQRDYYSGTTRKFTDANGVETTFEYWGSRDRLSKAVQAANHTSVSRNTKINYNTPSGAQLFESIWVKMDQYNVNDQSLINIAYYDNMGREAASRNKACAKVTKSYDGLSRLRKVTNPFSDCTETAPAPTGDLTERQYDALGRVKKIIAPGGAETVYSYAVNRTTVTDPAGKDRQLTYDAFGQLTYVTEDPGGLAYSTAYSYNPLGKLIEVKQDGATKSTPTQIRTFTYDSLGRLLTADNPEDTGLISYAYDDNGNLTSKTDARSVTTTHIYDGLNRLLKTTYSDGTPQEVRCYDGKQHNGTSCVVIFSVANAIGKLTMSNSVYASHYVHFVDPMGRITQNQNYVVHTDSPWTAEGYLFQYTYNRDGTLKSETLPSSRKIDYTYDVHGRPYSAGEAGGTSYVNSTAYTTHGALDNLQWGNLLTEQNCYSSRLQPIAKRLGSGTQTNCAHQSADKLHLAYGFGTATANNGNMMQQTITASSTQAWTQYYAYDELNRLSMASENAAISGSTCPAGATWCRGYGFDQFGNRWVSASLDTLHMATPTSSAAVNSATNRLTSGTYDAAGNMTAYPFLTDGGSIVYDANNKMTSFSKTGVSVATKYDSHGKRVRKIYNTETTVWVYDVFGRLAAEYRDGSGAGFAAASPDKEYVYFGSKLAAVRDSTNVHYRTTDHLGSTRAVTDGAGAVKQRRDYFPFGESIPADTSHGNRHLVLDGGSATYNAVLGLRQQFTSQQRDVETGLDYFWARNYHPVLGRFLAVDPVNAGASASVPNLWNGYSYVGNSPVRNLDPDGLKCVDGIDDKNFESCFVTTVIGHPDIQDGTVQGMATHPIPDGCDDPQHLEAQPEECASHPDSTANPNNQGSQGSSVIMIVVAGLGHHGMALLNSARGFLDSKGSPAWNWFNKWVTGPLKDPTVNRNNKFHIRSNAATLKLAKSYFNSVGARAMRDLSIAQVKELATLLVNSTDAAIRDFLIRLGTVAATGEAAIDVLRRKINTLNSTPLFVTPLQVDMMCAQQVSCAEEANTVDYDD